MTEAELFENDKYVVLKDVLPKDECKRLVLRMFELRKNGETHHDSMCPDSFSMYGDKETDAVLEKITPYISKKIGIELLPTFSFSRIYPRGEVLNKHIDREACEIAGTMTLGFSSSSNVWPIYFSDNERGENAKKFEIDVGDLVLYRGRELFHWRKTHLNNWQVQLMFFFVNANGEFKDHAFDKNENGHKSLNTK